MVEKPRAAADPTVLSTWIQIKPDNTVAVRVGVGEIGQGSVDTSMRQIVAEELRVPFEAITDLLTGDTDLTPDGGISGGVLNKASQVNVMGGVGVHPDSPFGRSALNVQKAAAYAYQELLKRASNVLGVAPEALTVRDGIVSSGSQTVSYAELVRVSQLDGRIPVTGLLEGAGLVVLGTPPVVPVSEYRVIGQSSPNPRVLPIVSGTAPWAVDVKVPGMLHGRLVLPRTLGSTLVSVGSLDREAFPNVQVIVQGSLVGVVAPDEWQAIRAAEALAETTQWSDWTGLPGSKNLLEALLDTDWSEAPMVALVKDAAADKAIEEAMAAVSQRVDAMYAVPYFKHSPIGPAVTVADVRADGTIHVWTFNQHIQALRAKLATMLEMSIESVVVHFRDGPGSFGRSIGGDGGTEGEAVLLSRACGRPVRLQLMRADDLRWSVQQAPYLGDLSVGLNESGQMRAFVAKHYMPGIDDRRLLGALLSGLPDGGLAGLQSDPPLPLFLTRIAHEWPYDRVPYRQELCLGAPNIGQKQSPLDVGLRHRPMRNPIDFQQNFGVECVISEAAAIAGADPIQFRIDHTSDPRLVSVLEAVREMSSWESRPSPAAGARVTGGGTVRGRGVAVAVRNGGYFAGVAEIALDLVSGAVMVECFWVAAEVGIVVNPRMLKLNIEGGVVFGVSQALKEELQFDRSGVTSTDFRSYPILNMEEMPKIEVRVIENKEAMAVGQGSEPLSMLPPVAIAGAVYDATGKPIRRLPMRPDYVLAELRGD